MMQAITLKEIVSPLNRNETIAEHFEILTVVNKRGHVYIVENSKERRFSVREDDITSISKEEIKKLESYISAFKQIKGKPMTAGNVIKLNNSINKINQQLWQTKHLQAQ